MTSYDHTIQRQISDNNPVPVRDVKRSIKGYTEVEEIAQNRNQWKDMICVRKDSDMCSN